MHRDLKLANILVHFPEYPHDLVGSVSAKSKQERKQLTDELLKSIDITAQGRL
jgi:hypothetical protein